MYGVLERPRGCAYNATVENVVKSVTMNYSIAHEYVTIAIRPSLEAYKIDGVMMSVNEARRWRTLYNSSYAEEYIAEDIDAILRREHGPRKYDNLSTSIYSQPFWRDDYTETMIQNSLRMLFAEDRLSKRLALQDKGTVAVVFSADIVLNRPIDPIDVQRAYARSDVVYLTANNDADGYTDGFYVGHAHAVSKILSSLQHVHSYANSGIINNDYERILKMTFQKVRISRRVLNTFGRVMHDFIKVRATGDIFASISCQTRRLVDEILCPKLLKIQCFDDESPTSD